MLQPGLIKDAKDARLKDNSTKQPAVTDWVSISLSQFSALGTPCLRGVVRLGDLIDDPYGEYEFTIGSIETGQFSWTRHYNDPDLRWKTDGTSVGLHAMAPGGSANTNFSLGGIQIAGPSKTFATLGAVVFEAAVGTTDAGAAPWSAHVTEGTASFYVDPNGNNPEIRQNGAVSAGPIALLTDFGKPGILGNRTFIKCSAGASNCVRLELTANVIFQAHPTTDSTLLTRPWLNDAVVRVYVYTNTANMLVGGVTGS